jgi:hypothetical protein
VPDSHSLLLYTEQESCAEKEDEKQILGEGFSSWTQRGSQEQ